MYFYLWSLSINSFSVTIQMKPLRQDFCMLAYVFQYIKPGLHIVVKVAIQSATVADQVFKQLRLNGNANCYCSKSVGDDRRLLLELRQSPMSQHLKKTSNSSPKLYRPLGIPAFYRILIDLNYQPGVL